MDIEIVPIDIDIAMNNIIIIIIEIEKILSHKLKVIIGKWWVVLPHLALHLVFSFILLLRLLVFLWVIYKTSNVTTKRHHTNL